MEVKGSVIQAPESHSNGSPSKAKSAIESQNEPSQSSNQSAVDLLIAKNVKENYDSILSAFRVYDIEENDSVTKGEFRRVIEINITPINTADFNRVLKNISVNRNGSVQYLSFLKFYKNMGQTNGTVNGNSSAPVTDRSKANLSNGKKSLDPSLSTPEIEKMLKASIESNLSSVLRGFRLFDYNRDKKIQFHELRKIIEQYCFQMSNSQFEKLWNSFDYSKMGLIDYMEFLSKLGVYVKTKSNRAAPQTQRKRLQLGASGMSFDQLEIEYRRKLKESHQLIKKALLVLDANHSGLIPLKNFKSVLDEFVLPVSEVEFQKLMERFSAKASHEIAWYSFLQKFTDPQSSGNGQTLPIRPGHKANPVRGTGESTNVHRIVQLLYNHILSAYSSLRNAFLQIDIARKGRITHADFKRLVQGFKFEISQDQLQEIMDLLDPDHTGLVTYQKFLEIFEEKESAEGHKWLVSTHKFNQNMKPAILAWNTVEELLQQKIVLHWKQFTSALQHYDSIGCGYISPRNLKRILDKVALPVSDEHFDSLMKRLSHQSPDGKINYLEFLSVMQIDLHPGDQEGVSAAIAKKNEEALQLRQTQHDKAMADIEMHALMRASQMSLEEIVVRLRDRSLQNKKHIRDVFLQMDDGRTGFVSKSKFREFLESYGIFLTDENFASLTQQLEFSKKGLDYMLFVKHFEGPDSELNPSHLPAQNHRFNAVRGDEFGMSALALESKLRAKISENFTTLREAFHKMDCEGRGFVTKADFRRLLTSFMCFTNEAEFLKLCQRLGVDDSSQLSYSDFLLRFQEKDDIATGHKWLVSKHRFNQLGSAAGQAAEDVHAIMAQKVHENYRDIARAFCHIDYLGRGYITKREFRDLLGRLNITMEQSEFKKLWAFYDSGKRNAITYQNFLKRVGVARAFSSGDEAGTSFKIIRNSVETTAVHLESQDNRQDNIVYNQAVLTVGLDAESVFLILQKRIKDFFKTPFAAFKALDRQEKGFVNRDDFRIAIHQLHLFVKQNSFDELMQRFGLNDNSSQMNYETFSLTFEEKFAGPKEAGRPRTAGAKLAGRGAAAAAAQDSKGFLRKLRSIVTKDQEILEKVFRSFDTSHEGRLGASDFRRVLDSFCFKLSDAQFKEVVKGCSSQGDRISYATFLANFSQSQERRQWPQSLAPSVGGDDPDDGDHGGAAAPSDEEVEERLREFVSARPYVLAQAFAEADYAQVGVVSKTDFRDIVSRLVMRLSAEQLDCLLEKVPQNEYGNVDYKELLLRFGEGGERPESPASMTQSQAPAPDAGDAADSGNLQQQQQPAVAAIEDELRRVVSHSWKTLFSKFKLLDQASPDRPKQISIEDCVSLLQGAGLPHARTSTLAPVLRRFGLRADGFFNYQDFVRAFVLNDNEGEEFQSTQLLRRKMQRAHISLAADTAAAAATCRGAGAGDSAGDAGMLGLAVLMRKRVLEDWKLMRKAFREQDTSQSGKVTASSFRRVLARHGVPLNDDQFYQVMASYDHNRTGSIDYNEFIRAFLRSA